MLSQLHSLIQDQELILHHSLHSRRIRLPRAVHPSFLPRHLQVSPSNPIVTEPYIKTTDELTAKWSSILATKENPVVGINWQGNPKQRKQIFGGVLSTRGICSNHQMWTNILALAPEGIWQRTVGKLLLQGPVCYLPRSNQRDLGFPGDSSNHRQLRSCYH